MKWFPDRRSAEAEAEFAEVSRAYAVLTDPALSRQLDSSGNIVTGRTLMLFGYPIEIGSTASFVHSEGWFVAGTVAPAWKAVSIYFFGQ